MTTWLWWILGTFGAAGIAVFVIVAPAASAVVGKIIVGLLKRMIETRIGVGILVAAAVAVSVSYWQASVDEARFQERTAEFREAQKARDERIRQETIVFVKRQLAEEYIAQRDSDDEVTKFKANLDPSGKCRIGAAGVTQLRELWGLGGQDKQRVRKVAKPRPTARP